MQTYEYINGKPVQEFIEWYEEKYNTSILSDLTSEFSYEELEVLSEMFINEEYPNEI